MEELLSAILYGSLPVEIPPALSLKHQMELVRVIVVNPSSLLRTKFPPDLHPWVVHLLNKMDIRRSSLSEEK